MNKPITFSILKTNWKVSKKDQTIQKRSHGTSDLKEILSLITTLSVIIRYKTIIMLPLTNVQNVQSSR